MSERSPTDPGVPDEAPDTSLGATALRSEPTSLPLVPTVFSRRVLRVFLIGAVAAGTLTLITRAASVLLLLFTGVLFAIFLKACAGWLTRRLRLPHWLSLLLVVVALVSLTGGLASWLAPRVADQVAILIDDIPASTRAILSVDRLRGWSRDLASKSGQGILRELETLVATAKSAIRISMKLLGGIAVFFVLGIYGAAQPAVYRKGIVCLVPLSGRARAQRS